MYNPLINLSMFDPGPLSQAWSSSPAQEQPCKRPRLTPYEEPHILAARGRGAPPKQLPEFQDLLVDDFASGKASANRVTWFRCLSPKFAWRPIYPDMMNIYP